MLVEFRIVESMPLRPKAIRERLRSLGAGTIEIKHRGIELDPAKLRKELSTKPNGRRGDQPVTIIVTRLGQKAVALLTTRVAAKP